MPQRIDHPTVDMDTRATDEYMERTIGLMNTRTWGKEYDQKKACNWFHLNYF